MNVFTKLWRAEPVLAGVVGNALFWPTVFGVAQVAGHPVDPKVQDIIAGAAVLLTGGAIRQTVTAPDTLDTQLKTVKAANAQVLQ